MNFDGSTAAQKEILVQIIDELTDVFAVPKGKLRFFDVTKHEIYVEEGAQSFCQRSL